MIIYIVFNMFWEKKVFELPNPAIGRKWYPVVDTSVGEFLDVPAKRKRRKKAKQERGTYREYLMQPRSIAVFVGR